MILIKHLIVLLIFLFVIISCNNNEEEYYKKTVISIIKEENSRNYNAVEKGLLDQIALDKLDVQCNFYISDNTDSSVIKIANNVRNDNSNIAIVIGENATLISMNIIVPQSIIFAGCFDKLSLKNIEKSKIQNNNITGVNGDLDIIKYIKMIFDKDINSLGYLYPKNSQISINNSEDIKKYCNSENIKYYNLGLSENNNANEIENIINSQKIDYLILANENYIYDNIYTIEYICNKYSIPIINMNIEKALNINTLFSLEFNYYYLGRELAKLLSKVIENNNKTDGLDFVRLSDSHKILINEDTAKSYKINFSKEILSNNMIIIRNGKILN